MRNVDLDSGENTMSAPVSTAPSKSPEFEGIGDAPVSTAAATTASASEERAATDLHNAIMNLPDNGGAYEGRERTVYKLGHRDARHAAAELAISRAADGQQGASRAVLDEASDKIRKAVEELTGPYFLPRLKQLDITTIIDAALARAPLPAPDDARLEVFIDWYLREGKRAEINPDGHMVRTTREQIMSWLDRAQSDTTGDRNAS